MRTGKGVFCEEAGQPTSAAGRKVPVPKAWMQEERN